MNKMKFIDFLQSIVKMGFDLWGIVNEDAEYYTKAKFLKLKSRPGVYEVDDWRTCSLRDKAILGWKIKEGKILCNLDDIYLIQEIETGGEDGGNCWGGRPERYSRPDALLEPFAALDKVLLELCPNLTYAEYVAMKKNGIIKEIEFTEEEYYGNSKDLLYRSVRLRDLYGFLSKR